MACTDKLPAKIVGPGVIRACDPFGPTLAIDQTHHAMPTDIGECSDTARPITYAKDRLAGNRIGQVIANLGKIGC